MVVPDHAKGLPVLPALSLCTCCRHYPGTATGGTALLIRPVMSAFPGRVAGSACASTFSRLTQRSLALRPAHSRCHQFVARLPEGFSHFVTSMTAPVASGWSGCRAGLAPAGKRRLITAHTRCSHRWARIHRPEAALQRKVNRGPAGRREALPTGPSVLNAGSALALAIKILVHGFSRFVGLGMTDNPRGYTSNRGMRRHLLQDYATSPNLRSFSHPNVPENLCTCAN